MIQEYAINTKSTQNILDNEIKKIWNFIDLGVS